jgi:dynein heavy chain
VWVHAIYIYIYANVAKEVAPKRQRLKEATDSLIVKQAALKEAQEKLAALQVSYRLREEAEYLEAKLDRADKLVKRREEEYTRWQSSIGEYNSALVKVTGDALIAAAFLSYAGPLETSYRALRMKSWAKAKAKAVPVTEGFNFTKFLARSTDVRDWTIQGLPKDDFSTENGVGAGR